MNKISQVTDSEVEITNDAGQKMSVAKSQINWDAAVGDSVNVYINGEDVNVTLAKKVGQKFNINIKFLDKKLLKVLMIGFSAALALFLIVAIIIAVKPHSSKYTYTGDDREYSITFSGNTATLSVFKFSSKKTTTQTFTYKIEKGKLYFYAKDYDLWNSEKGEYDYSYQYAGEISSTTFEMEGIVLKSGGTAFLKGFNTFLLVIAIILDGLCVAIFFLNKYGYATLSETPVELKFLKKNAGAPTDSNQQASEQTEPADEPTDEQPAEVPEAEHNDNNK